MNREEIRTLRTVTLPKVFGIKTLSQKRFGMLLSGVAKNVLGIGSPIAERTVQDWEHGKSKPSDVRGHILDMIGESIKKTDFRPGKDELPYWNDIFEEEVLPWMTAKLSVLIRNKGLQKVK